MCVYVRVCVLVCEYECVYMCVCCNALHLQACVLMYVCLPV